MIGPLSLGDLLVLYSIILVVYIVLTEFELMEFRKARERFNKVFGAEEKELEKEEYALLNEIKAIKQLVNELYQYHAAETGTAPVHAVPAPPAPPAPPAAQTPPTGTAIGPSKLKKKMI